MRLSNTKTGPALRFTVSARHKHRDMPIKTYLTRFYPDLPLGDIESLFGFVEKTTLYGGRMFMKPELSDRNVKDLNALSIGVRLPLTNHVTTREEYDASLPIFEKYHHDLNSIIATNDDLARWVRADFPKYKLDASVIKDIKTYDKLNKAMEIYDCVVLPMTHSQDFEFLEKIDEKDRIILFANGGCALTCPSRMCYPSISKFNKFHGGEFRCSQSVKQREALGLIDFNLDPLIDMGFTKFKLLRAREGGQTGF